jgi:hypothetical protein
VTFASPPPEPRDDPRLRARADLIWYLRHAEMLARWPVLPEEWALRLERRRLAPGDEVTGSSGPRAVEPPR